MWGKGVCDMWEKWVGGERKYREHEAKSAARALEETARRLGEAVLEEGAYRLAHKGGETPPPGDKTGSFPPGGTPTLSSQ